MFFSAYTNAILFVILPITSFCLFFMCVVNEMRVKWHTVTAQNARERQTTNPIWNQAKGCHVDALSIIEIPFIHFYVNRGN